MLYLHASSLFSKWGFGDGDCVGDWWNDGHALFPQEIDQHAVLIDLVRRYLVPAIEAAGHTIELQIIETIHNPVRAAKVDGVEVPVRVIYGGEGPDWADEISVEIRSSDLLPTFGRVAQGPGN